MGDVLDGVVRVLGGLDIAKLDFQGTGMFVAPDRVLTCKHVVMEKHPRMGISTDAPWPHLMVETSAGQRVSVEKQLVLALSWDLVLLQLATPQPSAIPRFLWGVTKVVEPLLQEAPLVVVGYTPAQPKGPPGQHTVGERMGYSYSGSTVTLTRFQSQGGLPQGCSGGPALLDWGDQWIYVGTAYLGGEGKGLSEVIAVDTVTEFLAQAGLATLQRVEAPRALAPRARPHRVARGQQADSLDHFANPYRSLRAFEEPDVSDFHGRTQETQTLVKLLKTVPAHPFVVFVGASGRGKSSLVSAGVIPDMRREPHWQIAKFRPRLDPFQELTQALTPLLYPALDKDKRRVKGNQLVCQLVARKLRVVDLVAMLLEDHPDKRLLLIADQFEELFTPTFESRDVQPIPLDRQRLFSEDLATLIQSALPCTLLMVLRADFMTQVLTEGPLAAALSTIIPPTQILGPMQETALRTAMEEPARRRGVALEPALADRILQDLGRAAGSLPLLQFTLTELWERRERTWLTLAAYKAIGGVQQALARHADEVLSRFRNEKQEQLRQLFVQLVRAGENPAEDFRQVVTRAQVGESNWRLLCQLADARLVVTGAEHEGLGAETAEVVHETLIHHWPPLQQWLKPVREFLGWQNRLSQYMQEWEARKREDAALLRGSRLEEAEEKLNQYMEELSLYPREKAYIIASIEQRDRELVERQRTELVRERLQRRSYQALLLIMIALFAGLTGALTRIPLSYFLGSFIELPVVGLEQPLRLGGILESAWNGFLGTFVGGLYFVMVSWFAFRNEEPVSFLKAVALATVGLWWGISMFAVVSVAFTPESLQAIDWYTHNIQFGFIITGTCWGLGIAVGTYVGDVANIRCPYLASASLRRLLGGLGSVLCFSLVSPWLVSFLFSDAMDDPKFMQRTWSDALDQCLSVWAILIWFYVLTPRIDPTAGGFIPIRKSSVRPKDMSSENWKMM